MYRCVCIYIYIYKRERGEGKKKSPSLILRASSSSDNRLALRFNVLMRVTFLQDAGACYSDKTTLGLLQLVKVFSGLPHFSIARECFSVLGKLMHGERSSSPVFDGCY